MSKSRETSPPVRQHTIASRFSDPNVQAEIERLERTIEELLQSQQRGQEERQQLLRSLALYATSPAQAAVIEKTVAVSHRLESSSTDVRPAASQAVSPPKPAQTRSPQTHALNHNRALNNVSPSRARTHTPPPPSRGNQATNGPSTSSDATSKSMDTWHHSYHGNRADPQQLTYKELLADNRAMFLSIETLQRDLRRTESEHEQRVRLMQRKLTEATDSAQQLRDRCLSLENEVAGFQRSQGPSSFLGSGSSYYDPSKMLLGTRKFSRSNTSLKMFERTRSHKES